MTHWDDPQLHLIRACLSQDAETFSRHASSWDRAVDIDDIDAASMRLIPLYFKVAQSLGVKIKNAGLCRGVYLKSWYVYKTQGSMPLSTLLEALGNCEAVFLKGVALRSTVYRQDPPTRPADDIDLLVLPSEANAVIETLLARGFRPVANLSIKTFTSLRNGVNLANGNVNVDVHWSIVPICLDPEYLSRIWNRAQESAHGLRVLSDTDNLIHALIHGYGANSIAPIRWVVDATLLIRNGQVDWELFSREICATGWSEMAQRQLDILRMSFGIETPLELSLRRKRSYLAWVSRIYLKSESIYLRRLLRILGWDFGVYATNLQVRPTLAAFIRFLPAVSKAFLREYSEYKSQTKKSTAPVANHP